MTWRAALYFFFGCFLGGYAAWANAGYALASPPAGMGFVPGVGYTWKPPVSTPPANGTWTAHGFVKHAGKNIPLPASWGAAANAGTFAKNALRFNPALFVGTAVAAIAIDAGLEYINDQWMASENPNGIYNGYIFSVQGVTGWWQAHELMVPAQTWLDAFNRGTATSVEIISFPANPAMRIYCTWNGVNQYSPCRTAGYADVPLGYQTTEPAEPVTRPATEEDWNFPVGPLTDTQLDELSRFHPRGLPVTNPVLEPVTEQIGQPYTDPVTGEQWRDMLRITPDPTASSPTRVRIDEYREPMTTPEPSPENPDPSPELDPSRNPEELPPELPLFCDWAGVVCDLYEWFTEPFEEPQPVEVPYLDEPDFDSSPLALPTSGSCPSPQSLSLGVGTFSLEFTPMCDLAVAIRPLVLAAAFLVAAFIVVGVRR